MRGHRLRSTEFWPHRTHFIVLMPQHRRSRLRCNCAHDERMYTIVCVCVCGGGGYKCFACIYTTATTTTTTVKQKCANELERPSKRAAHCKRRAQQQFNQTNTTFNKNASVCVVFAHRTRSTYHFNALYIQTAIRATVARIGKLAASYTKSMAIGRSKQRRLCTFVLLNLAGTTAHICNRSHGFLCCVGLSLEHNRAHIYD